MTAGAASAARPTSASAPAIAGSGRIGSALEAVRRELFAIGDVLNASLEPSGARLVADALGLVERQVCKVAVVGQIKAGKSSFVNALVQQPGLLPTDVNPATSAVTNLHFRQSSPSGHQALFHFFAAGEWERLAEGAGRLRELTERLVPGFEPALLRHTIKAVVGRAEARLGPKFHELLGTTHAYDAVLREVLVKYVCASDGAANGEIGLYADITRSADIYLGTGPFDFPVTLVDTPGTNDPFLMRDEITRSCLEGADAYVVVLTAHQPLSPSDVSLLRILRGLNKERIVVFINRIDELAEPEREAAEVVGYVRRRMEIEFPGFSVPVVAGSARWATMAATAANAQGTSGATTPSGSAPSASATAWARSGLPQTMAALDQVLVSSHCAHVLRQVALCFAEMVRTCDAASRQEIDGVRRMHQQAMIGAERAQVELTKVEAERKRLGETRDVIGASARQFEAQLRAMLAEDAAALRVRLAGIVDAHAAEERDALVGALNAGRMPRAWTCDTSGLRRDLSAGFLDGFARSQARLGELSSKVSLGLRRLSDALLPGSQHGGEPRAADTPVPAPSQMPLASQLAIDLEAGWWSQLWTARPSPDERGAAVEALVRGEFAPVVDDLVAAHARALQEYVDTTTRWSFAMCANLVEALERRQEQLAEYYTSLREGIDGASDPQVIGQQANHIVALERRLKACQDAQHRLRGVLRAVEGWMRVGAGPPAEMSI